MAYRKYQRAETVVMRAEVHLKDTDALVNPSGGVKLTLTDPSAAVILNAVSMSNDSVGIYHVDYTVGASALVGWWSIRYDGIDGSRHSIVDDGFEVEE